MKNIQTCLLTLGASLAAASSLVAASATMDPVGAMVVNCADGADTYVAVPLRDAADFIGSVASVASNTITVNGSPAWTANAFANTHYVRFSSGAEAGKYFTVTANGANTLTVDLNGDTIGAAVADDGLVLTGYWTLGTLFPSGTQTAFVVSTNTLSSGRRSECLFPDLIGTGTNRAAAKKYYITSTGWKEAIAGNPDATNVVVLPDQYIIIRNRATYGATSFVMSGSVEMANAVLNLNTLTGTAKEDNYLAIPRPVPVKLMDLNLSTTAFVESTNTLSSGRRDELLFWDTFTGQNIAPNRKFYKLATDHTWREAIAGNPNADNTELPAGAAFIIRKYQSDGLTKAWTNEPTY